MSFLFRYSLLPPRGTNPKYKKMKRAAKLMLAP